MQIYRPEHLDKLLQKISVGYKPAANSVFAAMQEELLEQITDLSDVNRTRCLKLTTLGVIIIAEKRPRREIAFTDISEVAQLKSGKSFATIIILPHSEPALKLVGVNIAEGVKFVDAFNAEWKKSHDFMRARVDSGAKDIALLTKAIERLSEPRRYPRGHLLQPFVDMAKDFAEIPPHQFKNTLSEKQYQSLQAIVDFYKDPHTVRDAAIEKFIASELQQMQSFFNTIEKNPLTQEQRRAVIMDDDATLILASAGSGKTSVIVAKVAYLINRAIRQPDEILLMSFTNNSAGDMSRRVKQSCKAPVEACTFHSLGSNIIKEVEGSVPALAEHAEDNPSYIALLRKIIMGHIEKLDEVADLMVDWFCEFSKPYKSAWDFEDMNDYFTYVREVELRTLGGARVKSFEELIIANWLFRNSIDYKYEPVYEHPLPSSKRRDYTPDFCLTESGIYIEHFGVRKEGTFNELTTAPRVNRKKYLEDMDWKREVHKSHGTTLVQTYSYEHEEKRLISGLAEKLKDHGVKFAPRPPEQIFEELKKMGQIDSFSRLMGTFLKYFKDTRLTIEDCHKRNSELELGERGQAFLKIFKPIFDEYQAHLMSEKKIDFEDMIIRATDHVNNGDYKSPFHHILVDEFQDISKSRADLLRSLKALHDDARIFAVGDDWQSIYRFSGSEVHLMSNFGTEFGGHFADKDGVHKVVDLGRTFRSVDKIALPARRFILQNESQIEKKVAAPPANDAPSIFVVWTESNEGDDELSKTLEKLNNESKNTGKTVSVLLLGRYRKTEPKNLTILKQKYRNLIIDFKTIHSAKGLEADHAIILRVNSGSFGFPNEIVDDPILNLVLPTPEPFRHAEERRVFYVALTRARTSVTILTSRKNPSAFAKELLEDSDYGVTEIGAIDKPPEPCPKCRGQMVKRFKDSEPFWACVNFRRFGCTGTVSIVEDSSDALGIM